MLLFTKSMSIIFNFIKITLEQTADTKKHNCLVPIGFHNATLFLKRKLKLEDMIQMQTLSLTLILK